MTRHVLRAVVIATAVAAGPAGLAAQPPSPPPPVVVVRGEGEVRVQPDVAFITLATEHRAATAREAQAQGAAAMAAVQQRLAGAGVAKDAIRTLSYDLQAQFDYVSGKQVPRGFLARNVVEVRADVPRVGELLEQAIAAGGTAVQGVRFDVRNRTELERQAITRAVADARARAAAAAEGAGATIVAVLRIEEDGVVRPVEPPMMRMAADSIAAAPPPPPIAAGETVIRATVTLTAAIK
ncbi:MAG: SIMPL domain-containing protein [Vicinamibacterales bacterium]